MTQTQPKEMRSLSIKMRRALLVKDDVFVDSSFSVVTLDNIEAVETALVFLCGQGCAVAVGSIAQVSSDTIEAVLATDDIDARKCLLFEAQVLGDCVLVFNADENVYDVFAILTKLLDANELQELLVHYPLVFPVITAILKGFINISFVILCNINSLKALMKVSMEVNND